MAWRALGSRRAMAAGVRDTACDMLLTVVHPTARESSLRAVSVVESGEHA